MLLGTPTAGHISLKPVGTGCCCGTDLPPTRQFRCVGARKSFENYLQNGLLWFIVSAGYSCDTYAVVNCDVVTLGHTYVYLGLTQKLAGPIILLGPVPGQCFPLLWWSWHSWIILPAVHDVKCKTVTRMCGF